VEDASVMNLREATAPKQTPDHVRLIKILLIEDTQGDADFAKAMLKRGNGDCRAVVTHVVRVADARAALAEHDFDVVIADLFLPDSAGIETLEAILPQSRGKGIIVASGVTDQETAVQAVRLGAHDFIVKGDFDRFSIWRSISYTIARVENEGMHARYHNVLQNLHDGFMMCDPSGKIQEANDALAKLCDVDRLDLIGRHFDNLWCRTCGISDYPPATALLASAGGRFEAYLPRRYGEPKQVDISASVSPGNAGMIVFVRDITARKKAEETLKEQEARLRAILENMVDCIMTISSDGRVLSANIAAQTVFGLPPAHMIGHPISRYIVGLETCTSDTMISNLVGAGRAGVGRHVRGTEFPLETSGSVLQISGQNILTLLCRDVSERHRNERIKDEFVSTVSHELRTPLTSIRGALGLVLGGAVGDLPDKARTMVDIAEKNCERLIHLVNDILDIQKIEAGFMEYAMKPVSIAELLQQSIAANEPYAKSFQVRIRTLPIAETVMVTGDFLRLQQVLSNLLSNAIKFSPEGEEVTVAATVEDANVILQVADNGSGIPEEYWDKLFDKFSQADATDKRSQGGTGLGLSIVKAIVQRHRGEVTFRSQPDHGTTFYITLPLRQNNTASNA
jgi:PAS domain S-box-containing protein